jgi:hypothetical protein
VLVRCSNNLAVSQLGRCVSAGELVQNYGVTNVAPTQKDKPFLSTKRRPHLQTYKPSWNEHETGHGFQPGSKPKMAVLTRASSNLLDWTGLFDRFILRLSVSRSLFLLH